METEKKYKVLNLQNNNETNFDKYTFNIRKEYFDKEFSKCKVSVEHLINSKSTRYLHDFNHYIRLMTKSEYKFTLQEILLFLENDFVPFPKLIQIIDDENLHNLKLELSNNNVKIKVISNKLAEFLFFEEQELFD